jgi:hypothetical protein
MTEQARGRTAVDAALSRLDGEMAEVNAVLDALLRLEGQRSPRQHAD